MRRSGRLSPYWTLNMIAFITSFRARALAQDWGHHLLLLERAVRSMLAQTRGELCVLVVCHEIPETPLSKEPRVRFLPVTFAPPARNNDDMCVDKVLKLSAGARWAQLRGFEYVAFVDADDLVSNRISGFVSDHRGENGWYCPFVLFHAYGGHLVRSARISAPASAPFAIVRTDLLKFEVPPFRSAWTELVIRGGEAEYLALLSRRCEVVNTLAAVGLAHYREYMAIEGHPLEPLPFPGIVMINHSDSTSFVSGGLGSYQPEEYYAALKRYVRWLPSLQLVGPALRREFLIPAKDEIPRRYQRGSIFWR